MTDTTLRSRLAVRPILVAPGVYDALTAHLAERAGFSALYVSGAGIAYTRLGRPDIGLVAMSEVADTVALIRDRVGSHLIVDADTGYGNALNVARTVRAFERAGANAIQIEDQAFPKRCGHLDGKEVVPLAEMANKLVAALTCRTDPDFCIIARTDARGVNGFDDAIERGRAFAKLGVDAVFIEAPQSEAELEEIPRALPNIPLLVNVFKGGKTPVLPVERLQQIGYRIAIYPSETQRAGIYAMRMALGVLKQHGTTEAMDAALTTFKERDQIVGLDDWQKLERQYMAIEEEKS